METYLETRGKVACRGTAMSPMKMVKGKSKNYSHYMLYDTEAVSEKLNNLTLAKCNPSEERHTKVDIEYNSPQTVDEEDVSTTKMALNFAVSEKMSCNYCEADFISTKDQRDHYRSDWHRFNLKRRLKGMNSVTEDEFECMAVDISSISGSDSSTDSESHGGTEKCIRVSKKRNPRSLPAHIISEQMAASSTDSDSDVPSDAKARRYPKIFFTTETTDVVSLYRCVLYHKSESVPIDHIKERAKDLPNHMKWVVLMCGGGHFAGAVFDGFTVICHKTFHRYIVRAKRGTAQSSRDSQGNAPKSAGASIRRHNEAALAQEIQELIASWDSHIQKCDMIFLRAPSFNSKIFFSGKSGKNAPFQKSDLRIRSIPFQTKRPTFNEVKRVHEVLASLECYGKEHDIQGFVPQSPKRQLSSETGKLEIIEDELDICKLTDNSDLLSSESNLTFEGKDSQSKLGLDKNSFDSLDKGSIISDKELFEYEYTRVQNQKKMRKKKEALRKTLDQRVDTSLNEMKHLRNSLYTACKTGDSEALKRFLVIPKQSIIKENIDHSTEITENIVSVTTDSDESSNGNNASCQQVKQVCDSEYSLNEVKVDAVQDVALNSETKGLCNSSQKTDENITAGCFYEISSEVNSKMPSQDSLQKNQSCEPMSHVLNDAYDDKQSTLLHVTAQLGHKNLIIPLLEAGADPTIKNKFGQLPYNISLDKETRNSFRRFMGKYPDKFDYSKAQIPIPLTAEQEQVKKQKKAEKNKTKKKIKQVKISEMKKDEKKKQAEEDEKKHFTSLSDREKRALTAERRFLGQLEQSNVQSTNRCWFCGSDLTGKDPFQYYDYKFCSPSCLQQHRKLNASRT